MTIHVDCSECGETVSVRDEASGKKLRCRCGAVVVVPTPDHENDEDEIDWERSKPASSKSRRARRRNREDNSALKQYVAIGAGGILAFLALLVIYSLATAKRVVHRDIVTQNEVSSTVPPPAYRPVGPQGVPVSTTSSSVNSTNQESPKPLSKPSHSGFRRSSRDQARTGGSTERGQGLGDTGANNSTKSTNAGWGDGKSSAAAWGDGSTAEVILGTLGDQAKLLFPALNFSYVLNGNQLVRLSDNEPLGQFPDTSEYVRGSNDRRSLSPDGKTLAVALGDDETGKVARLYKLGQKTSGFGTAAETLLAPGIGRGRLRFRVHFLTFLSPDRLAVGVESQGTGGTARIVIFNVETMKVAKEIPARDLSESVALSPDGNLMANMLRNELAIYDLKKGAKIAQLEHPRISESGLYGFGQCYGMAFAPDSTEIAALIDRSRLVIWNAKGKIIFDEVLARELSSTQRNDGVLWLPDQKSLLLGREFLYDRERKFFVWQIDRGPFQSEQPVRILDQDHALIHISDHKGGDLVKQTIPWQGIEETIGGEKFDEVALVKPGEALSVEVQVFNARFSNPQEVANVLGTALEKRVQKSNFKTSPNQPVLLQATYNEAQGEQKRIVEGFVFGRDTGQRVYDSTGHLEIKILTRDKKEVVWQQTIRSDGGSRIEGTINEASVREQMFKYVRSHVERLALPSFIPKPGVVFPLVTKFQN